MKRFQFGLDTVLQYKRQVLDGAQNEYAEVIQRVRQQERRLREAEARHRSLNQQFRRAEAEGITIADAMGYEMGLRMLEGEIQREDSGRSRRARASIAWMTDLYCYVSARYSDKRLVRHVRR